METRILIAEDDPRLREVLCDYFSSQGVRPVDIHIRRLREKLGPWARHIRTVIKAGYRLEG